MQGLSKDALKQVCKSYTADSQKAYVVVMFAKMLLANISQWPRCRVP